MEAANKDSADRYKNKNAEKRYHGYNHDIAQPDFAFAAQGIAAHTILHAIFPPISLSKNGRQDTSCRPGVP